jgi:serine protease AprX
MRKPVFLMGVRGLALGLALGLAVAPAGADVVLNNDAVFVMSWQDNASGGQAGAAGQARRYELITAQGTTIRSSTRPILNARMLELSHQRTRVALWDEVRADGSLANMQAIAIDGASFTEPAEASKFVRMRTTMFDPAREQPALPQALRATEHNQTYVVQFASTFVPAYEHEIRALGGTLRRFMPDNAQIVELPGGAVGAVAALPFVRGVTPYHPGQKIDEQILLDRFGWNAVAQAEAPRAMDVMPSELRELYNVLVLAEDAGHPSRIASKVAQLGGQVYHASDDDVLLVVELDVAQLAAVAGLDEVLWIDRWSPPEPDMDIVRVTGGADLLEETYGLTGQGVRGEVMDGNLRLGHVSLQTPPIIMNTTASGSMTHGTPVTSIIFGDGTASPKARGLAPDAQGFFSSYDVVGNRSLHTSNLLKSPVFASFQSNSWGNAQTMQYTSLSSQLDTILFNNDITLTQSQSNTGTQASRPQAWAKNIISVGGLNHYGNVNDADDCWCGYASRGPASDGRIKPDVALYYDSIFTASGTGNGDYTNFCCTSAATPSVAGHIALMLQMWHEGLITGYGGGGETVFDSRPSASLVKALLIHSAKPWAIDSGSEDRNRFRQGWGRPSLTNLLDMKDNLFIVDEGDAPIKPLETKSWTFNSDGSFKPSVTLVYRDRAGSPSAAIHRVNNISVRLTAPNGVVFWGNSGMINSNVTSPGTIGEDTINTVERIVVNASIPGQWIVEVIGSEINQDGNPATPELDSNYALVVSGLGLPIGAKCAGDLNHDGIVNADDLGLLLSSLGKDASDDSDINHDGLVDADDVNIILNKFGPCP